MSPHDIHMATLYGQFWKHISAPDKFRLDLLAAIETEPVLRNDRAVKSPRLPPRPTA